MACSSAKCEEYLAIDLAHLRRHGLLRPWHPASLRWARGNIVILPLRDGLRLIYRARRSDGEWEDVDQHVFYEWTETRFGGRRARGSRGQTQWTRSSPSKSTERLIKADTKEAAAS